MPEKSIISEQPAASFPLAVDLDGTLVKTDLLVESLLILIKQNPLYAFLIPVRQMPLPEGGSPCPWSIFSLA